MVQHARPTGPIETIGGIDKLMEVMFWRAESRQLTGRVDIDDAYLGGEVQGGPSPRPRSRNSPRSTLIAIWPRFNSCSTGASRLRSSLTRLAQCRLNRRAMPASRRPYG